MARRVEDRGRRADLDQLAAVEDGDPVGEVADHGEVVADEQVGDAAIPLQVEQEVENGGLDRDVQRRGRLVEDDQLGLAGERPRDGDALALPARELERGRVER